VQFADVGISHLVVSEWPLSALYLAVTVLSAVDEVLRDINGENWCSKVLIGCLTAEMLVEILVASKRVAHARRRVEELR
jgi:hypothetical protein